MWQVPSVYSISKAVKPTNCLQQFTHITWKLIKQAVHNNDKKILQAGIGYRLANVESRQKTHLRVFLCLCYACEVCTASCFQGTPARTLYIKHNVPGGPKMSSEKWVYALLPSSLFAAKKMFQQKFKQWNFFTSFLNISHLRKDYWLTSIPCARDSRTALQLLRSVRCPVVRIITTKN